MAEHVFYTEASSKHHMHMPKSTSIDGALRPEYVVFAYTDPLGSGRDRAADGALICIDALCLPPQSFQKPLIQEHALNHKSQSEALYA